MYGFMKKWRSVTIAAILGAFIILIGSDWFAWEPERPFRFSGAELWTPESSFFHRFALQEQGNGLLSSFSVLATIYLSGILTMYAFPEKIRRMEIYLAPGRRILLKITLLGLLISIVIFTIGLSSSLTMETFPLAIFLGSILFISAFLGFVSLAYALGHHLLIRSGWDKVSPVLTYLLGLTLLFGLAKIPYLGIPLRLITLLIGVGLITATRFGSGKPWNLSALHDE
jgi:hypothetical protein